MTKLKFLLLCDAAAMTVENKIVIHGVFDNLSAKVFPALHPSMTAVFQIEGEDVKNGATMSFVLKNKTLDKEIFTAQGELQGEITESGFRGIVNLTGVVFENVGEYEGILTIASKEVGRVSLHVTQIV